MMTRDEGLTDIAIGASVVEHGFIVYILTVKLRITLK
jgi:hypothetical protein